MKLTLLKIAGVFAVTLGAAQVSMAAPLQGDYVEARTASVFAGPCHYSGEYMSDGRDAVVAWHVASGDYQGVSLAGLSAVAVVRSDDNLGDKTARKTAKLYVDSAATPAQRTAMVAALKAKCGDGWGASRPSTTQRSSSARARTSSWMRRESPPSTSRRCRTASAASSRASCGTSRLRRSMAGW